MDVDFSEDAAGLPAASLKEIKALKQHRKIFSIFNAQKQTLHAINRL